MSSTHRHIEKQLGVKGAVKSADELLKEDRRSPILYLRSFEEEASRLGLKGQLREMTERVVAGGPTGFELERQFGAYMNWVGPFICLARKGQSFFLYGAARKDVSDHKWQATVRSFLRRASYVIVRAGTSPGFAWEIEQILSTMDPLRVLLITPGSSPKYREFLQWAETRLPHLLPRRIPRGRLLMFDKDWVPVRPDPGEDLLGAFHSFFVRTGVNFPANATQAMLRQKKYGDALRSS